MDTDLIIIALFLALNVLIGLYHAKSVKTFRDYVLGNELSPFVLICSLVASVAHIGVLGEIADFYFLGFKDLITFLMLFLAIYFGSRILTVRMSEFLGDFSIAESMGRLYGPIARKVTGTTVVLVMLGLVVAQLKVILTIVHFTLSGITDNLAYLIAIAAGLVVILYSVSGGARSIAMTDVFQFICFGTTFPLIACLLVRYAKIPISDGWAHLKQCRQFFDCSDIFAPQALREYFFYGVRVLLIILAPLYIQRLYMSQSIQKAKKAFTGGACTLFCISLLVLSIAIALHLGGHVLERKHDVIHYIINLTQLPGIRSIIMITVLSLLMSTIDSALHLLSVVFVHDILPQSYFQGHNASIKKLKTVRITILLIGILALCSALAYKGNIYKLIAKGTEIYIPVVSIPWAMAVLGFRPHRAVVLMTMAIAGVFVLYSRFTQTYTYHEANINLAIAMVISLSTLIIGHYLLPKDPNTGWIGIKERGPLELQNQETKRWWTRLLQGCKALWTNKYWTRLFPKQEATFVWLGIYIISSTLATLWFMQKEYFFPYIYLYIAVMALGTLLTIYPALHSYQQGGTPMLHRIWPGVLFILLFIASIQFAKLGHFRPIVAALVIANLGLATALLSFKVGIGMLLLAIMIHHYIPPSLPFWDLFWIGYREISMELIFAVAIGMAALVGCSLYKYLSNKADVQLNVIELSRTYERKAALESIYSQANWSRLDPTYGSEMLQEMGETLQAPCAYLYAQGKTKLGEDINRFIKKLNEFSSLLLQSAKEARRLGLDKHAIKAVAIGPIILKAHSAIRALGSLIQLLVRNQTAVTQLATDPGLFERLLTITLLAASNSEQATDHVVVLTITDTTLRYGSANAVQANKEPTTLPGLAFCISTDPKVQSALPAYDVPDDIALSYLPKTEEQLYQAESRQIVQAHGGYVEIIETKAALTALYILPVAGETVMHFKTYDPADLTR